MTDPDVRVDPVHLEAAGAALTRLGADAVDAARAAEQAIAPQPAWDGGFDTVAAAAALADADLHAVRELGAGLDACAGAMHAAAAAWVRADQAIADRFRNG